MSYKTVLSRREVVACAALALTTGVYTTLIFVAVLFSAPTVV